VPIPQVASLQWVGTVLGDGRGSRVVQQPGNTGVSVSLEAVCRGLQQRVSDDALTVAMLRARIDQLEVELTEARQPQPEAG
jgi:hypothetical protein